ncbi:MAG: hypothetical protein CMF75_07400 [Maricaulis sp.]|nr:hypothetical protein [Maricaulis sp.]
MTLEEIRLRRLAIGSISVLAAYCVFWMLVGGLTGTGTFRIQLFGDETDNVFNAMPWLTYAMLSVYAGLIFSSLVALLLHSRWCLAAMLIAIPWHLAMWSRVAFNPYMPAWPGLIFVALGVMTVLLQMALDRRGLLR